MESEEREGQGARARMNRGVEMLTAFRDAISETIQEARERGDLSTDRAREALRGAYDKARTASADARDRFDFVSQSDFDALRTRVDELERRVRTTVTGDSGREEG